MLSMLRIAGIKQAVRDAYVFGLLAAIKYFFRSHGSENIVLDIPIYGKITVRPLDSDYATVRQIFRDREYAIDSIELYKHLESRYEKMLNSGRVPVIVDAGANIGVAAIWFARQFERAEVVAIEPDKENAYIARLNCSTCARIHVVEAAVGAVGGFVNVLKGEESWGNTTERSNSGCPIVTIDEAVRTVENGELFIAKIDIEGFEADLFKSNYDWIGGASAIFLEPHDWLFPGRGTSRAFQSVMGSRGFEIFISGENLLYINFSE